MDLKKHTMDRVEAAHQLMSGVGEHDIGVKHELPDEHPHPWVACQRLCDTLRSLLPLAGPTRHRGLQCNLAHMRSTKVEAQHWVEIHSDGMHVVLTLSDADAMMQHIQRQRQEFLSRLPRMRFSLRGVDILAAAAAMPSAIVEPGIAARLRLVGGVR